MSVREDFKLFNISGCYAIGETVLKEAGSKSSLALRFDWMIRISLRRFDMMLGLPSVTVSFFTINRACSAILVSKSDDPFLSRFHVAVAARQVNGHVTSDVVHDA